MTASFASYDGTVLAYRTLGEGPPLVCLPGGPGRTVDYFGDLAGLGPRAGRALVLLETRGTGASAVPADPATYRCDRLTGDVEALRAHLGLGQLDLLAHSAAADLALLYAARYPERIGRMVLVSPGLASVGLTSSDPEFYAAVEQRSAEPWFAGARAALAAVEAGDTSAGTRRAYLPFLYGRWDETARAHVAAERREPAVGAVYYAEAAFDPERTRAQLAKVTAPVLILAGELDINPVPAKAAQAAALFPAGELVLQPGTAHFPWLDDPALFTATLSAFLTRP